MKVQVIENDIDKTLEQFGLSIFDEIGELFDQCWEDDVKEIEFTTNFDYDYDELIELGATKHWEGDGWNEPRQYYLHGDASEITERIMDNMLQCATPNENAKELIKFIKSEVHDAVLSKLD